jgi:hypothetical protein
VVSCIVTSHSLLNSRLFWDITSCNPSKVNRYLGGTFRLHLRLCSYCYIFHSGFLLGLFFDFDLEDGGDMFLRNVSWLSVGPSVGRVNCWWPRQHSRSWYRVPWDSWPYFTVSRLWESCNSPWVYFQQTTRRYIPKDRTFHNHSVRTSNPTHSHLGGNNIRR